MADEPPASLPAAAEPPAPAPAAAEPEKPEEAEAEEGDEEDALLDRAQALISRVVGQEADPNPRLIHTLATICEDQEARYAPLPSPLSLPLYNSRSIG
jgi:HIV-1 Vpr-binding protein